MGIAARHRQNQRFQIALQRGIRHRGPLAPPSPASNAGRGSTGRGGIRQFALAARDRTAGEPRGGGNESDAAVAQRGGFRRRYQTARPLVQRGIQSLEEVTEVLQVRHMIMQSHLARLVSAVTAK